MTVINFETVREIGLSLAGVVESTSYGSPALKREGKLLACIPANKSAEVNSLVVHVDFERRDQLVEQSPAIYYVTDHYRPYPFVLVRLSKIKRDELSRLLHDAHAFALSVPMSRARIAKKQAKPATRKAVATKKPMAR